MKSIPALVVKQWLPDWEKVAFSSKAHRRRPEEHFYLFTLPASWLKALSGISRRSTQGGVLRSKDLGIQRRHDENRSSEIREFIRYGYPWSELSARKRKSGEFDDLRKPGWLPTAIVVNILRPGDTRRGLEVAKEDLLSVVDSASTLATVELPTKFKGANWRPSGLHPLEVIDGQHRLWAFEDGSEDAFELPVVAFHGLDISWQAYLFWTINIKPKRINASLAFDLYPLLRTEDWLEKFEGHSIYRETRAQELTEAMWAFAESPWYQRINMLGESGLDIPMVSQAAWIRTLTATFVKRSGGLFGTALVDHGEPLPWSRAQQAAFLILLGQSMREAVSETREEWAISLRKSSGKSIKKEDDPAFYGEHTLLSTDQGIRGLLNVANDLCYARAKELKLEEWRMDGNAAASDEKAVSQALAGLKKQEVASFLSHLAAGLAKFDWRSSSAPGLTEQEVTRKSALRGGSGYRELRQDLLKVLTDEGKNLGRAARAVLSGQV